MQESNLFQSGVQLNNPLNRRRTRWITVVSLACQTAILAAFLAYPLLYPASLPLLSIAPKVISIHHPEVKPPVQPHIVRASASTTLSAPSTPAPQLSELRHGGITRTSPAAPSDDPPAFADLRMGAGGPAGSPLGTGTGFGGPSITVVPAAPKRSEPLRVSSGVTSGMLLTPIRPVYPVIARMSHTEGTVVVTATIDKQGRIAGLQVLSGPDLLRTSAIDAIREARYRPFLLSGEPTNVITTISVTFRIGG